jgi:mono/diheme cytochrome c family protein
LALATLACMGFVATLAIDLDAKWAFGIRPGEHFRPSERYVARRFGVKLPRKGALQAAAVSELKPLARSISAANGRKLFLGTCMSCHGDQGQGLPGQGKPLVTNTFIASLDDAKLLDFVKAGRPPWDPMNTTKVQMPPRGGNPMLNDDDLRDIVAYVRTLQSPAASTAAPAAPSANGASNEPAVAAQPLEPAPSKLAAHRWIVSSPPGGPEGIVAEEFAELTRPEWRPPRDAVAFANGYYAAAQFGGLHAIIVASILGILCVHAIRFGVKPDRRAPLALGAAGAAMLAITWLLMFPFVYLI